MTFEEINKKIEKINFLRKKEKKRLKLIIKIQKRSNANYFALGNLFGYCLFSVILGFYLNYRFFFLAIIMLVWASTGFFVILMNRRNFSILYKGIKNLPENYDKDLLIFKLEGKNHLQNRGRKMDVEDLNKKLRETKFLNGIEKGKTRSLIENSNKVFCFYYFCALIAFVLCALGLILGFYYSTLKDEYFILSVNFFLISLVFLVEVYKGRGELKIMAKMIEKISYK